MTRLLPLLVVLPALAAPPNLAVRQPITFEALRAGFAQPDAAYAPFMFWFWDEPVDAAKQAAIARKLISQRINPGYAHPRTSAPGVSPGNPLPPEQWLSAAWFDAFDAALREAEAAGMYLGYCDEYMWPSFQAAGRVLRQHPELEAHSLVWETHDLAPGATVAVPACAFAVAARLADDRLPERPAEPPLGQWIWKPQPGSGRHHAYLRRTFDLPAGAEVQRAVARLTVDNRYTLYVNGQEIGTGDDWTAVRSWDVAAALRPGRNVVAVDGGGDGGLDALTLGLRVELGGAATVELASDATWRVADEPADGWTEADFGDSGWSPARVVATDPGAAPWRLSLAGPHRPATILSSTLRLVSVGEAGSWRAPVAGCWRVYVFHSQPRGTVDYLDHRLPAIFEGIAHEPYAARFGGRLGRSIPGVFVDNEGDYGDRLAWSVDLARHYADQTARDIRLWMPLLLDLDAEGTCARARWDWFDAVSDVYADTMGSTSRWLEQRGMYCIENLWEESLPWQAQYVGDFLKLSRAYSMPGTDALGRRPLDPHDFKEAGSVAELEGRRLMNELMGAGGWGVFTPPFIKQATNSVMAWGVAHVVPHGVFTHRDLDGNVWTPDWLDENPTFPWFHLWSDFVRRASWINSHGRLAADVLLVNPMDSVWAAAGPGVFDPASGGDLGGTDARWGPMVQRMDAAYSDAIRRLTEARVEFLTVDRHYLRQMTVDAGRLQRDDWSFRTVVLPPLLVLPRDVAEKLVDFAVGGGRVYALGELPTGSTDAGFGDPEMIALMAELRRQRGFHVCASGLQGELAREAPGLGPQTRLETGGFALLQRHVRVDGRDLFWLVNNTADWQSPELTVRGARGAAAIWHCETGRVTPVGSRDTPGGSRLSLRFAPYQAFWLVFDPQQPAVAPRPEPAPPEPVVTLDGPWLVRIDPDDQPDVQHPVTIPPELAREAERPLDDWSSWGLARFSGRVDYRTEFDLDDPAGPHFLDLGLVCHGAEVWVNGRDAGARLWPPHALDVTGLLRPGRNEVRVRVGNLVNNSYGDLQPSGLFGPVTLLRGETGPWRQEVDLSAYQGDPVPLAEPSADHSQPGYSVRDILTDDHRGWGAWDPSVKEPIAQTAVVETVHDVGRAGATTELIFTIKHDYAPPEGLNLGRFRLSATTDSRASFADSKENGGDVEANWTVLRPVRAVALRGTLLRVQPDGSVLAVAGPLERETYLVVCRTNLSGITGFRLEALEDKRLPGRANGVTLGGPGRSPGEGNYTVTWLGAQARNP